MTQAAKTFDRIEVLSLPLKSKFRGLWHRELVLVQGERWAEFSPFVEYPDSEAAQWLRATMEWAFDPLPELKRRSIPVNATLPAVDPNEIEALLKNFQGSDSVKIKVAEPGQAADVDLKRIQKVRELDPTLKIRLDANGLWSLEKALEFCRILWENQIELEYLEQPVATISELAQLKHLLETERIPYKIAADESVRKVSDPLEVAKAHAADILVLKSAPLGGIKNALRIYKEAGLEVVVSSALESSIGMQSGLHLAGAIDELNYSCGLGTASLFTADVTENPLIVKNGQLEIREVIPSEELILKLSASEDRKEFWLNRLNRCLELL